MDNPTPKDRVEHILNAIGLIKNFVKGVDEARFSKDIMLQNAVQYQFLIIGEAIRHIDIDILGKYEYQWHIPRSFRNYIIHDYHEIKLERIYNATQDLDTLEKQMRLILKKEFNKG